VAALQVGGDEVVLAGEVRVQGRRRDACALQDGVDPCRGDAAFVDLFSSLVQHGDPEGRSARYAHHLG